MMWLQECFPREPRSLSLPGVSMAETIASACSWNVLWAKQKAQHFVPICVFYPEKSSGNPPSLLLCSFLSKSPTHKCLRLICFPSAHPLRGLGALSLSVSIVCTLSPAQHPAVRSTQTLRNGQS